MISLIAARGKVTTIRRSWIVFFALLILFVQSAAAASPADRLRGHYKSALVVDMSTGQVLYEKNAAERSDPASLVKMMLVLLAMEGIQRGELRLEDRVTISARAAGMGGQQLYLAAGEVFPLEDLLKAVMIGSANDAAYAVAEHIAGSQEVAVQLMNARAKQLGMHDTHYVNVHGLPESRRSGKGANYTTAQDLVLLSKELMKYPLVMKWASSRLDTFRDSMLLNTNHHFLRQFTGAEGLKTGYHPRGAGFCLVGSAVRDGRRLLAVILGAESPQVRLQAASQLLDLGFAGRL